ncbi:MAG TPA: winged helix-turn-helix domain-containing protein, partial [Stellaceae bacterium]|nr:winged helix-turn-helix domain-containing protein [Stellaceae bacterium]
FDILAALVERAGEVVGKEELIARVWQQTFVEESNLKIQVSALRRALGDGQSGHRYVVTVPGRGYNFVAPVSFEEPRSATLPPPTIAPTAVHNLPFAVTRMIGRDDAVATLVSRRSRERLVTIVGSGGIGKSTLALAVAERVIAAYEHGVWLVDLAPLADPRLVPSAVATVLGLEVRGEDPLPALVAGLRDKRMLLLLDNCEHVIDAAAGLASAALVSASGVAILATSREPLRVAGEREYRLGPLASPVASPRLTAAEALLFPAVQLFVERATEVMDEFALRDVDAPLAVEICRRLDGLPLAIEFAAARVRVLGLQELADHLDQNLQLLGSRRRMATPRHRTMLAVLDWSYGLLNGDEQQFFRALGIFSGGFTVEAASAVAADTAKRRIDALELLAGLVAKSLVVADVTGAEPRFRLLDTTRAYAIEKLEESGDRQAMARRHAAYYRDLFERAEGELAARPTGEWLGNYAREIDNLRAALDWAFSPSGDGSIAVPLTAAAVSLWLSLSLLEECRSRAKQALGALGAGGIRDPRDEMRLHAALGASTSEAPEMGAAFTKVLEIAESLGDSKYQLRALQGLYFYHGGSSRYDAALPVAQKFHDLAMRGSDPSDRLAGECMIGAIKHCLGDQISARRHLEQVLAHYAANAQGGDAIRRQDFARFWIDVKVSARVFLARVLWMQGFSDRASRAAETSLGEAAGHNNSACFVLGLAACPIALWVGDLAAAAHYAEMLLDRSRMHGSSLWAALGSRFHKVVALKGGGVDAGSGLPHSDRSEIAEPNVSFRFLTGLSDLAEALAHAGRIAEGLALLEAEIERSEASWLTPELLRLKGELFLLQGAPAAVETAEALFRQALDEARRQGALAWELRTATSLARLLRRQGRPGDAAAFLQPVYDRFTEGFGTADLIAARRLLE